MTCRILIIDDDREMCEEIRDILEDEGYSVRTAFDGNDGLALIEEHGCDVLLLDLKMPGLDGLAILRKMKEATAKPKILVVTAKLLDARAPQQAPVDEEIIGLADDVLSKPFSIPGLLAAIRRMTAGRCPPDQ
jgi:DNA-binding response OmpR family regulator